MEQRVQSHASMNYAESWQRKTIVNCTNDTDFDNSNENEKFTQKSQKARKRKTTKTITESWYIDARHAGGDLDWSQTAATRVFANRFISIVDAINGRKVIT